MATARTQPRRRLSKEARRAQLIAAAEAVFSEVGHSRATMEAIAAHDGVTRSLLYEHFGSIDEIYLECHRTAREQMQERLLAAAALAGDDLREQLRLSLTAYFDFFREYPQRFEVLYGPGGPGGPLAEQTAELRFITAEWIAAQFSAAAPWVPRDEAVAGAHIISGAAEQLARWSRRNPETSTETLVEWVMLALWPGMENRLEDAAS
jgi:AcrR family transcriptional regulator